MKFSFAYHIEQVASDVVEPEALAEMV